MIYVPILTDAAPMLSAAIYQLTRPQAVRDNRDVSSFYCAWYVNPNRPQVSVLEIPETETIPLHSQADGKAIETMLQYFVGTGDLTQQEVTGIASAIVANAGKSVPVAGLIPPSWQPFIMDRQTAIQAGWLEQPKPIGV